MRASPGLLSSPGLHCHKNLIMSSPKFMKPLWHLVDARHQIVGRLATQIVHILRGKHKPTFCPNYDCGDYVVIINARHIKLTGKKITDKKYTWHTGIKYYNISW